MDVNDHGIELRNKAIGMLKAGLTLKKVSESLNVSIRSVQRWSRREKLRQTLGTLPRSGRPKILSRVPKIIISKTLCKRSKSTRSIARNLVSSGYPASHSTVYRYLRHSINVYPYKRQCIPRLAEKMKQNRLNFALKLKNWTVTDWEKVLWSDESPFQLFAPPNRQNDRVWSRSSTNVQPFKSVKFSAKIQVWGMMSHQALSELHIIPQKQTINGEYYRNNILKGTCMDAMKRTANSDTILKRSMIEKMSESIFMQDGAPAHTAKLTQAWCSEHLPGYWAKADWPGNSPDLNPIENLWSILKDRLSKLPEFTTINSLVSNLKKEWAGINPAILQNLAADMPNRIREVINRSGDYIGK